MNLTADQRMDALRKANEIRSRRAQLKRDVRAGRAQATDIITAPPAWADTMRVACLLKAAPGLGDVKVSRLLERAGVPLTVTITALTTGQRRALAASVGRREPGSFEKRGRNWGSAMELANTVRAERSKLHNDVAVLPHEQGRERVSSLLEDPPACIASLLVVDLLAWVDGVGPFHAGRMMSAARVSLRCTVKSTTERQRKALAACLRGDVALVREEADVREWAARAAA